MGNNKVDIVVKDGTKIVALIEVKVSKGEPLQDSQKKKHEYEKTAEKEGYKLIYIFPNAYNHEKELPEVTKNNKIKHITWEEILRMPSVKGTSFAKEKI